VILTGRLAICAPASNRRDEDGRGAAGMEDRAVFGESLHGALPRIVADRDD
jgi:hypothetical protein